MRAVFQAAVLSLLMSLLTGTALARDPFTVDTDQPADFQAVEDDQEAIKEYLEDAQCGGFNLEESVEGKIATVTGVPGREGDWNGAPLSGMGTRKDLNGDDDPDNDYKFPDTAEGLTTACMSGKEDITKRVWRPGGTHPGEVVEEEVKYPHPKFEDPGCRWRIENPDGSFSESAPDIPLKTYNEYDPALVYEQLKDEPADRQSHATCMGLCAYLNTWQYLDCDLDPDKSVADGGMLTMDPVTFEIYRVCPDFPNAPNWVSKYLCTDKKVNDAGAACEPDSPEPSNSRACKGEECRCEQDAGPNPGNAKCMVNPGKQIGTDEAILYYSYVRNYKGSFTRDAVPSEPDTDDRERSDVPVACYGFYDEFDPKFHPTEDKDRRCVINIDVSGMRESQKGKGGYGKDTDTKKMEDFNPLKEENQRKISATGADIWYLNLGWGFSFLNEDALKNIYDENLANAYLDNENMDRASMTASWPIHHEGQDPKLAVSDSLRSFDDTGTGRIVVSWWQKQQTDVSVILHPQVVRLLMPPGYAFGADPLNPVLQRNSSSSANNDPDAKRSERIEIQIDASEDVLGEALRAVERSFLLRLVEEPVPVLVPMGSPTEFRAKAQEWRVWWMRQSGEQTLDNAPPEVLDLITKSEDYAEQIEHVRELRAEVANYDEGVMKIQTALTKPISDWMKENLDTYLDYLEEQRNFSADVAEKWRETQEEMTKFTDVTNLPWCMIQARETPVYSLLDNWLPARADGGRLAADDLPNITAKRQRDLVIDFSGINYMTGALVIPVLKPVQVRLDIPHPPSTREESGLTTPLPDLPSILSIRAALRAAMNSLPEVEANGSYPPLDLPETDEDTIDEVKNTIDDIKQTVADMNDRYDKFWQSIGPLSTENVDEDRNGIPVMKEREECKTWNDGTCQHVEMDLMERFQRIGSRKLVLLKEDYETLGERQRGPNACNPSDQVCLLLHGERTAPTYKWQIDPPKTMPDVGPAVREAVRNATLPVPVGGIPKKDFPTYDTDVKNLLPFYDVPRPVDLTPPTP